MAETIAEAVAEVVPEAVVEAEAKLSPGNGHFTVYTPEQKAVIEQYVAIPTAEIVAEVVPEVVPGAKQSPGRGHYTVYTPEQKAVIGRYAVEHGNLKAVCSKFSQELGIEVKESTVRQFKKAFFIQLNEGKDPNEITALRGKKRGRPSKSGLPAGAKPPANPSSSGSAGAVVVSGVNGKDSVTREFGQIVGEMAISTAVTVS